MPGRHEKADAVKSAPSCNVPTCQAEPEWRGLCSAHRQTHRGLATEPKESSK